MPRTIGDNAKLIIKKTMSMGIDLLAIREDSFFTLKYWPKADGSELDSLGGIILLRIGTKIPMIRYACIMPRGPKIPHSNKSGIALNVAVPKATTVVTVATPNAGRRDLIAAKAPSILASLG